ncbi:4238_t:CDS:1, partial [Scutellospora calospora]
AKTAINIALATNKDAELVQILKDFIAANQTKHKDVIEETNNSISAKDDNFTQDTSEIILLQQHLIDQLTSPKVTKIHSALCKKRIKGFAKISKRKKIMNEITNVIQDNSKEVVLKQQCKYLLCKNPGHYQKKCLFASTIDKENE